VIVKAQFNIQQLAVCLLVFVFIICLCLFSVTVEPDFVSGHTIAMVTVPASAANSVVRFMNNSASVDEGKNLLSFVNCGAFDVEYLK